MNVSELRKAIENLPDDMPVFFRRVAPIAGNIERAGAANKDTFSSFGVVQDCLIIEPITDDDDEAQTDSQPDAGCTCAQPWFLEYEDGEYCKVCGKRPSRNVAGSPVILDDTLDEDEIRGIRRG